MWGVAYRINGIENIKKALGHLTNREMALGGYQTRIINFHQKNKLSTGHSTVPVLVYYANPENRLYLGGGSYNDISLDIFLSFGTSGSNVEYLFRLADFMRSEVTGEKDEHLFSIETLVRLKLNLCTKNILSWLELVKNNTFLNKLRDLSEENSENLVFM